MKKNNFGFTIIELLIYITISSIIMYGVFFSIETISKIIYDSDKNVAIYQELDSFQDNLNKINSDYQNYTFSTGSIFGKSESGFEACLFTNKLKDKGIVVGVMKKDTQNIFVGNIVNIFEFVPFISEVGTGTINNILSNKNINDSIVTENKTKYNINLLKFNCNKKSNYTKFDFVIIPNLEQKDIGKSLNIWNKNINDKISLSIIK